MARSAPRSSTRTWVIRSVARHAGAEHRDAAGREVLDRGVVPGPQSEKTTASRASGASCGDDGLAASRRLPDEQHAGGDGLEHLGEAVEHGDREGVAEGHAQAALDEDADRARAALAQRRRERVGPGEAELGGGGTDALGGRLGDGALAAEDEGGRRHRHAGALGDVAQRRAGLTSGDHGRHAIETFRVESIRTSRDPSSIDRPLPSRGRPHRQRAADHRPAVVP